LIGWLLARMVLLLLLLVTCVSVSLRTETSRENMGQCKSEGKDFKERLKKTWDSVSVRAKTLKNR
jgi:hypothetical protein